jgi:PiT family inorganic phosphate transporter
MWGGIIGKVLIPAVLSPVIAALVATAGTWAVYRVTAKIPKERSERGFRWGQIGSASLVSLAHGTNDAQKTMGVIFLALIAHGAINPQDDVPFWVKLTCALAIALGTYLGGWRIIRTLGKGLVELSAPQGMAAETSSAAIILTSSHLGLPLSTTHVATGSILGTGLGRKGATVRWKLAGRMAIAWVITLPAAAVVGGLCWAIGNAFGGLAGVLIVFAVLVFFSGWMYWHSKKTEVSHHNVNDDWEEPVPAPVTADTGNVTSIVKVGR